MPNGTYGGVRGRKTKVGRKLSFSSYSIKAFYGHLRNQKLPHFCNGNFSTVLLHTREEPEVTELLDIITKNC